MGAPLSLTDNGMPKGHKGQRGLVLTQLKRAQPLTARELAFKLGVSLNAARHHLKELEAEGLVSYSREHRGVGAPVFTYRLSPAGEELFPRRYGDALTAMLGAVVEREGRGAAVGLLESYFAALAGRMRTELAGVPRSERLAVVARLLSEEGYMAEAGEEGYMAEAGPAERSPAERSQGEGSSGGRVAVLTEHNCAIPAVAERFPEICAAEARFLAEVLGAEVERTEHILSGCPACAYRVRFGGGAEESS